ncbi:hypothetical protein, partial [uncultured Ruminococcus sp.]|uniref:hypothetical protein n=1 Tax=uncultured Ruminococcus sp. TaxID=165186 RepID=UPI002676E431
MGKLNGYCEFADAATEHRQGSNALTVPAETAKAIPHKERLATLPAICLQISLQSLFRIFPHA